MKRILSVSLILVLIQLPAIVMAQPSLPGDPSQAPIDGGLGILAALGGAYALKKLRENKQ